MNSPGRVRSMLNFAHRLIATGSTSCPKNSWNFVKYE